MTVTLVVLAVVLGVAMTAPTLLVVRGPTIFDRAIGAGTMGTTTLILICLVGGIGARLDMFIDIAIAYAMLNFVSAIAVAKYLAVTHGRDP